MEEAKAIGSVINKEDVRIIPQIGYYLKSKNIRAICKYKCLSFAAGGKEGRIYLFSNSLEHMSSLCGHQGAISSLCLLSNNLLVSGSKDKTIKIWDLENLSTISKFGHSEEVSALCYVREGVFVSGSDDKSLVIWSKSSPESTTYSLRQRLTGHTSGIQAIFRMNKREILSGEFFNADLRIWNIDEGICIRHIPNITDNFLIQIKQQKGEIAISYSTKVKVWGAANNWRHSFKQFSVCYGLSIEFLDGDLLLRGGWEGDLEFIDYAQIGCQLPPSIQQLHSKGIAAIQRIAKNIVVTASDDSYLKVIDPISRKCYLSFKIDGWLLVIAYFY